MDQFAHKTEGVNHTQNMRFHPFVFTGKEKDSETGYGYFGARYMDHELMTMWLSVDPMADKYPSISPYAYCAWNPVKLVDPDGKDVWEVDKNGHVKRTGDDGGENIQTIKYANGHTSIHEGNYYHDIFSSLSEEKEILGDEHMLSSHHGGKTQDAAMANVFYDMATNTDVEWRLLDNKQGKFEYLAEGVEHNHPRYRASGGPEQFDVDGQIDSGHQQENDDQRDDECPNGKRVG